MICSHGDEGEGIYSSPSCEDCRMLTNEPPSSSHVPLLSSWWRRSLRPPGLILVVCSSLNIWGFKLRSSELKHTQVEDTPPPPLSTHPSPQWRALVVTSRQSKQNADVNLPPLRTTPSIGCRSSRCDSQGKGAWSHRGPAQVDTTPHLNLMAAHLQVKSPINPMWLSLLQTNTLYTSCIFIQSSPWDLFPWWQIVEEASDALSQSLTASRPFPDSHFYLALF